MGGIKSKQPKKYVLLYGPKEVGKTLALYSTQARFNNILKDKVYPTEGVNYEEVELSGAKNCLGIFDVSGDLIQYDLVNIICKSVEISGLIFIVPGDKLDLMDVYREQLKLILNNKFLDTNNFNVLILYNMKAEDIDKLKWIEQTTLDEKLKAKQTFSMYANGNLVSKIVDVNNAMTDDNNFKQALRDYCDLFE